MESTSNLAAAARGLAGCSHHPGLPARAGMKTGHRSTEHPGDTMKPTLGWATGARYASPS